MENDRMMVLLEEIRGNVQLIAEGHAHLNQKIDRVEANLNQKIDRVEANLSQKIDRVAADLSQKIDKVADDLAAHREDTEVHRGYQVAEH